MALLLALLLAIAHPAELDGQWQNDDSSVELVIASDGTGTFREDDQTFILSSLSVTTSGDYYFLDFELTSGSTGYSIYAVAEMLSTGQMRYLGFIDQARRDAIQPQEMQLGVLLSK